MIFVHCYIVPFSGCGSKQTSAKFIIGSWGCDLPRRSLFSLQHTPSMNHGLIEFRTVPTRRHDKLGLTLLDDMKGSNSKITKKYLRRDKIA